jgi:very-short-patch-repair endonuclease
MAEKHPDFLAALARLVEGKSAFSLPFGRAKARQLVGAVTVLGSAPAGREGWVAVQELVQWRDSAHREVARWSAISMEFGLTSQAAKLETTFRHIVHQQSWVEEAKTFVFEVEQKLHHRVQEVFGKKIADQVWEQGAPFISEISSSLTAHLDRGRLGYAMKRVGEILEKLRVRTGPVADDIQLFLMTELGVQGGSENELQARWLALQEELFRINNLASALGDIRRGIGLIEASGAPKWATRLRTQAQEGNADPVLPMRWREAWDWRLAFQFLEKIDVHKKIRDLFEQRRALTASLSRTYQDLVAEKTWLGVFNNSPQSIRQALQSYLNSIQAMGSGTGVRAVRHRRNARDAMQKAYMAVPCWVLPQWRVSETIPPEVGLFDLVIIDEASQSDIWALPALLRGKKLLVVGDHKQVSPSAVGLAEQKIVDLEQRFLRNQFHGAQMTPDKSVYDLAKVVFAGNSVMLKEHFRCVPAIIEFSNREFYSGDIKPLRVPKTNERLDPPLMDVFVKGGFRKGDINAAEAAAIVNEVEAIVKNPSMLGRSIGIVTLLGTEQAKYINDMINQRITPGDIVKRKIAVGPPPVFQGRERDIMMVSMVLGAGDRTASTIAAQQQRFNVAFSRARDRMYLFRSVEHNQFSEDSLSGKVLRHFRQPFNQDVRKVAFLRDLCESGFEKEMFDELTQRGYRVQPQVPCGSYRIDFVVEGNEGRRLAVECDGDRFHGPGQWSDDMARQRVLERAGWTFWRCFASSFARRRQEVLADLLSTLNNLGIAPLGAESMDNTLWVKQYDVDPLGVDTPDEDTSPKDMAEVEVSV